MQESQAYDVLIIGAGQAGIPLAYSLAGDGKSVALAERKHLGGSCVNFGCTPTKAAIASGEVAAQARRAAEFGVTVPEVGVDFPKVLGRARGIVEKKTGGIEKGLNNTDNPELIWGQARIEGRESGGFRVNVGDRTVLAREVVLDTGTRTAVPPVEGLSEMDFIHSGNWLQHEEVPGHLAVIGGGYIGLEMAQLYRRMGSRVTVIGSAERVAKNEDEDVSDALQRLLEEEGVEFRLGARAEKVEGDADGVRLSLNNGETLQATDVFVATGRRPNTDDLGLENAGLDLPDSGVVEVDERLRTAVEGLWAAGDIRGGPMFTHTAYDDFRVIRSQMTGDGSHTTERVVPYAIFTDPELGRVGMTEREARDSGYDYEVKSFDMANDGKAQELGETAGFIKVIVNRSDDTILGAAVLAHSGGELVHLYVDLMNAGAPYTVMRDAVHTHPTLAEAVQSAVAS
ncbi:mercuric reductase [Rubrobacter aplysinae]|uniref:mercuric reductase n=1 Tax=Rubrobacter aplysinae TaxID=909625 RepID=UPI00064B9031|nr:mercuric reductase [Rubrobacter aplysinae]